MYACEPAEIDLPKLKTILHSGATNIPQSEMTSVDVLIHKGTGVARVLAEIAELAQMAVPTSPKAGLAAE